VGDDLGAGGLGGLLEFVGETLTIGGTIVDDGDLLGTQLGDGILASTLPCCSSLVMTRNAVLKPCAV